MTSFRNKCLMITGGTGSFGSTVLKHFISSDIGQIRTYKVTLGEIIDLLQEFKQ